MVEVKFLKEEKNEVDVEINSLTLAELVRVYLNKEGADIAAWKREHPSKNPVLHVKTENAKKLIQKAIASAEKDLDKVLDEFKKSK